MGSVPTGTRLKFWRTPWGVLRFDRVAGAHTPPAQTSGPAQALPSLQGAFLAAWVPPAVGLQPAVHRTYASGLKLGMRYTHTSQRAVRSA